MGDVTRLGYSERDNAGIGAGTMSDADGLERVKGKLDITTPDKTNKTPILVSC